MHLKPQLYKLYSTLQQLPILSCLYESISINFIEPLLTSASSDSIPMVIDWFSKQAIFILINVTCTFADLAQLLIVNVFFKHGILSHVTCDCGSEFISYFFCLLGEALNMHIYFMFIYYPETDSHTEWVNQTLK